MPKNKQQQQALIAKPKRGDKPKQNPRTRAKRGKDGERQNSRTQAIIANQACGLTDPFCDHAIGMKYPDNSSTRTLTFTYRSMETIVTDANGNFAICYLPKFKTESVWYPALLTGSLVTAWTNCANVNPLVSSSYRIVSAGMAMKRIGAPLYAAGSVHLRSWITDDLFTHFGNIDVASYNCSKSLDLPYQDCSELTLIPERTPQLTQAFYLYNGDVVALTNNPLTGYYPITVYGAGLQPNTAVFTCNLVTHVELTLPDSDGLAQLATRAPTYNPIVVSAAKQATSTIETFAKEGIKVVSNAISKGIRAKLAQALGSPSALPLLVD